MDGVARSNGDDSMGVWDGISLLGCDQREVHRLQQSEHLSWARPTCDQADRRRKWIYVGSLLYIPSVFTTKAAILLLFSRIFAVKHLVARAIKVMVVLLFITLVPIECLKIAICRPVSAYWEMSTTPEELALRCVDQGKLFKADIAVAIVTDFIILLMPIPLVFSLSFPLRKKIRILLSLATGGGAVGVALYKGILVFNPVPGNDTTKNFALLTVLS